MFYNNLFTINSQEIAEGEARFVIQLAPEHRIYKGHFPGDGITPGVCILQMASDLFSLIHQQDFAISNLKSVKFMQLIRPSVTPTVTYEFTYQPAETEGCFDAKCTVSHENEILTKTTLTFSPAAPFLAD